MNTEPLIVEAIYPFKGSNNDELCFKKGDIITITQKDEGWWEGTLDDKTGWFPSNYVVECQSPPSGPNILPLQPNQYRNLVLKDLLDSETAFVTELDGLVTNFLQPLEKTSMVTQGEYKQLTCNILQVLEAHQQLLSSLEAETSKSGDEQRIGKLFLNLAQNIQNVHQTYCSLHPKAVCILEKHKDELTNYMESRGAASPGVLVLTTMLSKPFRRLDKYSAMLQELARHTEKYHSDRGDTQRSVSIYKEIAACCSATRRQKELELQVLTGPVRGWEGPSLTTLGEIIHMSSVAIGPQHQDRYFVLFPSTLVILSVSHRLSAFIYEGKIFLSNQTVVKRLEDRAHKNAFEISAPMIETIVVTCQTPHEAEIWVNMLQQQIPRPISNLSQSVVPSQLQVVPQAAPNSLPFITSNSVNAKHASRASNCSVSMRNNSNLSPLNLRPIPPLRFCLALGSNCSEPCAHSGRKELTYKEDGAILDVIEAYCSVTKMKSSNLSLYKHQTSANNNAYK